MNRRTIAILGLALLGTLVVYAILILMLTLVTPGLSPQLSERVDRYVSVALPATQSAPPESLALGSRLVIPSIAVDAGMIVVGVDEVGVMETPDNGRDVGWYDFSAVPGQPGNTVMTGHVDYYDIGPAVFWRLRDLSFGDEVRVHLADGGEVVTYQVSQVESYEAGAAPLDAIIGPIDDEVLTLITCTGRFNPSIREYDHRLVVRAVRVS